MALTKESVKLSSFPSGFVKTETAIMTVAIG